MAEQFSHPMFYNLLCIFLFSFVGAFVGSGATALAMAFPNRFILYPLDFILWYIPCIMESSVRGAFQPFTEYPLSKYFPGVILVLAINVISIADDAINYGGAKETVVPDTVKFIADNAFKESYSLEDIYLTKNVSYIGKSAFKDSKDLTIHAPTDSYAHTFATENKINFKATDH